jgi:GT2 family glycosyltransferase
MKPQIDVVILTWNDGEAMLSRAVGSALASEEVDVQVIVVDNGSTPPATVAVDARVTLIRNEENRGVAGGRNQGVAAGTAPLVCLLDSDARLAPATLRRMLEPLLGDDHVGLVAPVFTGQRPEESGGRAPSPWRKLGRGLNLFDDYGAVPRGPADRWWDVDFTIGACQLFRRVAYQDVGGIDEAFFYGPEDVDFCLRLRNAGWRVLQDGAASCHHPPRRRFRRPLSRKGMQHAAAIARHLWRHRHGAPVPSRQTPPVPG